MPVYDPFWHLVCQIVVMQTWFLSKDKIFKQYLSNKITDNSIICLLGAQIMSIKKINAHWRRKQVQKVRRRAHSRFFRFRVLRGHNSAQILLRAYRGNRATERLRKKYHRRKHKPFFPSPAV